MVICLFTVGLFLLVGETGSVIVDGFQSLGAVADSSRGGDLHWPMLGGFMGYDHVWGFHWIGWPWLRSLLLPLLPWSPKVDLAICCGLWALAAMAVSRIAEKEGDRTTGILTGLASVLAPGFLIAAQSYRPEIPTALGLVLTLSVWNASSRSGRLVRVLSCVILPILHPLGLVVPGTWCAFDFLRNLRPFDLKALLPPVLKALPLLVGAGLMFAWMATQPEAWEQFSLNLRSQRMLIEGLGTGYGTFFRWGIGSLGALPLVVLITVACLRGAWLVIRSLKGGGRAGTDPLTLAGAGVSVTLAFNIVAKNPNSLHLVAILPLAAWLFVSLLAVLRSRLGARAHLAAVVASSALFCGLSLKQSWKLVRSPGPGFRASLSNALESLPQSRRILIPVAMWEAAVTSPRRDSTEFQFSTFPNLLPNAERKSYEEKLMSKLRPGDLLIWDPLQDYGGIFNFVTTTALRHQVLRPPDDPLGWERLPDLRIPVLYSRGQSDRFELYRKR